MNLSYDARGRPTLTALTRLTSHHLSPDMREFLTTMCWSHTIIDLTFFIGKYNKRMQHAQHEILSHLDRGPEVEKFLEQDRLLEIILTKERTNGTQKGSYGSYNNRKGKRRRPLYTQLLILYPALLDDHSAGMMRVILNRSHHWDFNAFLLDRFSGGHSLSNLCLHIFHTTGKL